MGVAHSQPFKNGDNMESWKERKKFATGYKKFMTDDEVKKLLSYLQEQSEQIKIIFYILIFMGLRVSEVCSLKKNNILGNRITYRQAKNKRLHTRIIPSYIKDLLFQYIDKHQDYFIDDYLFPPMNNRSKFPYIQTSTIRWILCKFRRKYNLDDSYYVRRDKKPLYRVSVHTLRHSFLTRFYSNCKDLMLTSEVIGHKKIDVTADYIKAWNKHQEEEKIVNSENMILLETKL